MNENMNSEWPLTSGWSKLVNPLIRALEKTGITIAQTKEKFGEFRCYVNFPENMDKDLIDTFYHAIDAVTTQSRRTCIECGETKGVRMYVDGWHLPLCEEHAKNRNAKDSYETRGGWLTNKYKLDKESAG